MALLVAFLAAGCAPRDNGFPPADVHAIVASALSALFVNREHAAMLTIYTGRPDAALTLADPALARVLGLDAGDQLVLADIGAHVGAAHGEGDHADASALNSAQPDRAWPLPTHLVTIDTIEAHFARYPDGWARWYERYPESSGIIEIAVPERRGSDHASVLVGRSCGEHCRAAWRVFLTWHAPSPSNARWTTDSVAPLPLPRS